MKIQEIRSACVKIIYGGKTYLVDPWLKKKGEDGIFNTGVSIPFEAGYDFQEKWAQPLCELPLSTEEILVGVDANIVTHLHFDHVDVDPDTGAVGYDLDKDIPLFTQDGDDRKVFEENGFKDIHVLGEGEKFGDAELIKIPGYHGQVRPAGKACGVVFRSENEPTVYLCGDTIFYDGVKQAIEKYRPDIIITNNCAADMLTYGRLIMDDVDTYRVHETAPDATIVAVHMDNVAHLTLNRANLKRRIGPAGYDILDSVRIPEDGEVLEFEK